MKNVDTEKLLAVAEDMYKFNSGNHDALNKAINEAMEDELSLDDLEFVSAAAAGPDYAKFLERMNGRK